MSEAKVGRLLWVGLAALLIVFTAWAATTGNLCDTTDKTYCQGETR